MAGAMTISIPANKVAEFVTAKTPERRKQIVRQVKHGKSGHPIYYTCFHGPAKEFLVTGVRDASGILRAIEDLKTRTKSSWYVIDSRITSEALRALIKLSPELHALPVTFTLPGKKSKTVLPFPDAEVTVSPNLLVHGERSGKPLVGALRFYLAKESPYQLGVRGAELVAVMEYEWLKRIASGARTPDPELCMVLECIQQRITKAPVDTSSHVAAIERGVREFAALWHLLDDKEAA